MYWVRNSYYKQTILPLNQSVKRRIYQDVWQDGFLSYKNMNLMYNIAKDMKMLMQMHYHVCLSMYKVVMWCVLFVPSQVWFLMNLCRNNRSIQNLVLFIKLSWTEKMQITSMKSVQKYHNT